MTRELAIRIISGDVLGTTEQTHEAVAMAVEALKRTEKLTETHGVCSDELIKRTDAIDTLNNCAEFIKRVLDDMDIVGNEREKFSWGLGLIESIITDIEELPSAQQWIPVSSGNLPKLYEPVMISAAQEDCDFVECGMVRIIGIIHRKPEWIDDDGFPVEVTAWMPLPKPFREVGDK